MLFLKRRCDLVSLQMVATGRTTSHSSKEVIELITLDGSDLDHDFAESD